MEIVYDDDEPASGRWPSWPGSAALGREGGLSAERPVLIDRFLEDAIEVDVDAIRDATGEVLIGGVMEHVEEAGVHSGDCACVLPPPHAVRRDDRGASRRTRGASPTRSTCAGSINVQYAVQGRTRSS